MSGETQFWINVLLGLATPVLIWLLNVLWGSVQSLRADIDKLRTDINAMNQAMPATYQRRDDAAARHAEILEYLRRIDAKIDGKADRP